MENVVLDSILAISNPAYTFSSAREWTKARLDGLINPPVEENLSLEYKAAGALDGANESKKVEITKDVSAFANSSGGTLIYGIAEFPKPKWHLPERLDPVDRNAFSKERLEQVIQTIQPRISGITIHPVEIDAANQLFCYVVEIPASHTAHQARDHIYYKRNNFNVLPMEDYEVRDVMNRRTHPEVRAWIWFRKVADPPKPDAVLLVKVENVSPVMARHAMVKICLPVFMDGWFAFEDEFREFPINKESTGFAWTVKARIGTGFKSPLFPGDSMIIKFPMKCARSMTDPNSGHPLEFAKVIETEVFADSSPSAKATLSVDSVLRGWTPCWLA